MRTTVRFGLIIISTAFAFGLVAAIFAWSEKIIHYQNNFTRRFPPHAAQQVHSLDLKFNSYYFAGSYQNKIYLGNFTAPLQVMIIDTTLKTKTTVHIELKEKDLPFQTPQLRVLKDRFFVYEGTYPYIYKGDTSLWIAALVTKKGQKFSQLEPITENLMAVRYDAPNTGENLIGTIDLKQSGKNAWNITLLQKQIDGIFDTDGQLQTDVSTRTIIYTYLYRNQYTVVGSDLKLKYRGNTIDTVTKAKIVLEKVHDGTKTTMAAPPLTVNRITAVGNSLLFVNSTLPGQHERDDLWKTASIIDVYDLKDHSYQGTIPIFFVDGKKLRAMYIYGDHLFALINNELVSYYLRKHLTN